MPRHRLGASCGSASIRGSLVDGHECPLLAQNLALNSVGDTSGCASSSFLRASKVRSSTRCRALPMYTQYPRGCLERTALGDPPSQATNFFVARPLGRRATGQRAAGADRRSGIPANGLNHGSAIHRMKRLLDHLVTRVAIEIEHVNLSLSRTAFALQ